ncbi:hypothetical protein Tco_0691079 [Tanacetum coccineum]
MAEQNVPAQPPTRTDEQIVPRSQWLTIGKSNLLFNAQKIQKNPIFQISVDILKNTNFFQALTASANVPAIYLQHPLNLQQELMSRIVSKFHAFKWLTIGKSKPPQFNAKRSKRIHLSDITGHSEDTNFIQALTVHCKCSFLHLHETFWKTMSYNEKTGVYSCQLDEQWFDLSANLLRKALAITPVNPSHPFELPSTGDTVLDFVNELG